MKDSTKRNVTAEEYLADLRAVHASLDAIVEVVSKLEHAVASSDARVRESTLKEVGKRLSHAIDATATLGHHISVAELMGDMDSEELEIVRARLGHVEEEEDDD